MQLNETQIAKFWSRVHRGDDDECWLWHGGKNDDGYGRVSFGGGNPKKQAHHVSYFLAHGHWPSYVLHSCDTPACVNPRHLSEGTHQQNIQEAANKGRFFGGAACHQDDVPRVRDLLACGCSNTDIARWLGIDQSIVSRIKNGKVYRRLAA